MEMHLFLIPHINALHSTKGLIILLDTDSDYGFGFGLLSYADIGSKQCEHSA